VNDFFNQDSEVAVLSIILKNPESVYDLNNLKFYMFSSTPSQALYSVIQELVEKGTVPEKNLVFSYLQSVNKVNTIGGKEYLDYLVNQSYNRDNLKEYERQIIYSFKARSLVELTLPVPDQVKQSDDIESVISTLKNKLDNLDDVSGSDSVSLLSRDLKDIYNQITERLGNPGVRGIPTGFEKFDNLTGGLGLGDLMIIAGRPGIGKSAAMCNSMLNTAKRGNGVIIFSLEMQKQVIVERMLAIETGIPLSDIRLGLLNQEQLNRIRETLEMFRNLPIYIDSSFTRNSNYVFQTIRKFKKLHDVNLFYIDYLQLLAERNVDMRHELGRISGTAKLLANELEISGILFSQLSRACELRPDKRPILSDLRESGNLEEDVDIVSFLYRDDYYYKNSETPGVMEFIIAKNRNGPIGMLPMGFNAITQKIKG
jgi:replicative DNA helicase